MAKNHHHQILPPILRDFLERPQWSGPDEIASGHHHDYPITNQGPDQTIIWFTGLPIQQASAQFFEVILSHFFGLPGFRGHFDYGERLGFIPDFNNRTLHIVLEMFLEVFQVSLSVTIFTIVVQFIQAAD